MYCIIAQILLLPPFPEPFTPVQRERALVQRLKGGEPGAPSVVEYAFGRRTGTGFGAYFDEASRAAAIQLGGIAQKAVSLRPEDRYPSPEAFREALEAVL